jgi:sarcosine oxidase
VTRADYVVIGGGVVGVCAAYHLARKGKQVLLIERSTLAPASPLSSSGEIVKMFRTAYGEDRKMTKFSLCALDWWRQFEREAEVTLFEPTAWLIFDAEQSATQARWPAYAMPPMGFAKASTAVMQAEGLAFDWLSRSEILERFPKVAPNELFDCALLDRTAGLLQAQKAVKAIGRLAQSAGAELWENTSVEQVVRSGDRVDVVHTSKGEVEPGTAILLTAGYMNLVFSPELRAKTRVTREQMVVVRPRDPDQYRPDSFPTTGHFVFPLHGDDTTKIFAGEDPDSKIVDPSSGDPAETYGHGADEDYIAKTRQTVRQWVPDIADAPIVSTRSCFYTSTRNGRYLIYRRGNAVTVSACSGTGFKHGPMTALVAAELAQGNEHEWYLDEFRYQRHSDWCPNVQPPPA